VVDHAYTVLSAVEFRGKRFLKIRNPWGASEWTGRWSDGSKEWSDHWFDALKALNHRFGVSLANMVSCSYNLIAASRTMVFLSWNMAISSAIGRASKEHNYLIILGCKVATGST
jgi:hypothetical protein